MTAKNTELIRIAMIEDDLDVAAHIQETIESAAGFRFQGAYNTGKEGLREIEASPPDLVIVDLSLPDLHGSECISYLRSKIPTIKTLVFTVFEDEENIIRAIRAGADGYLLKDTPSELLLLEFQVVMMGGSSLTPRVARRMAGMFAETENVESPLSARESEVLHLVALGYTYSDIADELDISPHTVRRHIERVYRKLDVHSKSEAIIKGRRFGLLRSLFD